MRQLSLLLKAVSSVPLLRRSPAQRQDVAAGESHEGLWRDRREPSPRADQREAASLQVGHDCNACHRGRAVVGCQNCRLRIPRQRERRCLVVGIQRTKAAGINRCACRMTRSVFNNRSACPRFDSGRRPILPRS